MIHVGICSRALCFPLISYYSDLYYDDDVRIGGEWQEHKKSIEYVQVTVKCG